jgi:hypothetical protein
MVSLTQASRVVASCCEPRRTSRPTMTRPNKNPTPYVGGETRG